MVLSVPDFTIAKAYLFQLDKSTILQKICLEFYLTKTYISTCNFQLSTTQFKVEIQILHCFIKGSTIYLSEGICFPKKVALYVK